MAAHERQILALEGAAADEGLHRLVRLGRARDHEQARRIAVEPVHDPGTVGGAAGYPALEQSVDERARCLTRCRMDDDPRRLVDNQQMRILVDDGERNLLRGQLLGRELRHVGLDRLPSRELIALRSPLAIHLDRARGEEPLRRRTRAHRRLNGQEAVEPRPRRVVRNQ